jgi:hypothetical protein
MSRTLVNKWSPSTPMQAREAEGWTSSGVLAASTVIKAEPGLLGRVDVVASDNGGDIDVVVWDSPTSTTTNDEVLARVAITTTTDHASGSWVAPSGAGVAATLGMYVQLVAGHAEIFVYYK